MSRCFVPLVILLATSALAQPHLVALQPSVVRLNSVIEVRGQGLGPNGTRHQVSLVGRIEGTTEVRLSLPAVAVGDHLVRAPLTAEAARVLGRVEGDGTLVRHGRLLGEVSVDGAPGLSVALDIFPPDMLVLVAALFGLEQGTAMPPWWGVVLALLVAALFMLLVVFALFAGVASWFERRVAGRMQNRVGPNRVGPQGFLQWLADGLKAFLKEDFIPPRSLPFLFRIAPYFPMLGVVLTFVTLPFGQFLCVSDLNVGVYYVLAVTGLTVVGLLLAGFSSANKWSLIGGFRSAAQIVSYEIPSGLAVATVVAAAGSLGFSTIIERQGGYPWDWYLFQNPFTLVAFFVYLIGALAEGNRTPFDLPEAESELVAGYFTEYSGMRFVFFMFAEWGNLYVMSALMTALFLGGWQVPGFSASEQAASLLLVALGWALFTFKALFLVFVVIWFRWTLPRIRVDQLMTMCWKFLVPVGMVTFLGAAAWAVFVRGVAGRLVSLALFAGGVAVAVVFVAKVVKALRVGPLPVKLSWFV